MGKGYGKPPCRSFYFRQAGNVFIDSGKRFADSGNLLESGEDHWQKNVLSYSLPIRLQGIAEKKKA
jgi:hypothetical protein